MEMWAEQGANSGGLEENRDFALLCFLGRGWGGGATNVPRLSSTFL